MTEHEVSEHQVAAGSAGSGKLAGLFREYCHRWEIEQLDPGSAWVAVTRIGSFVQVIAARDLDELPAPEPAVSGQVVNSAEERRPRRSVTSAPGR
jgi:hypothetical protein